VSATLVRSYDPKCRFYGIFTVFYGEDGIGFAQPFLKGAARASSTQMSHGAQDDHE
jgi:hypothetical protein